jgi:hypothetical protein
VRTSNARTCAGFVPATLDVPAQDFGFIWSAWKRANNFDGSGWHAPAGLKSDDDSAKITAQ